MKQRLAVILASLALSVATSAHSQTAKVTAYIDHSGNDPLGQQLSFFIKEQIRASATFSEASKYTDGGLQLHLITLDPDHGSGYQTIYSATITVYNPDGYDYFITAFVGNCGTNKIRECAASLYGDMGAQLEEIRKALQQRAAR